MKKLLPIAVVLMAYNCTQPSIRYPETRKDHVVDTFYNVPVEDPYRWLEDDNSEETKEWVKAQNKVTFGYLESLPNREQIKARLTELWDYPKVHAPFNISERWLNGL